MGIETATFSDWQSAALVVFGICTAVLLIGNIVKLLKDLKKPTDDQAKMVIDHERRISRIEEVSKERDRVQAISLRSQMAVLNHLITGDGREALNESQKEIQDYLIGR